MIIYFLVVIGIIYLPLRLAAQFSDAENISYSQTLIVAVLVAIAQTVIAGILFQSFPLLGTLIAIIVTVMIGMKLFGIPSQNFLKFAGLFLAMNYLARMIAIIVISS
ncbi:hypothetical protein [Wohlfahrtiimonas larvae]|uniref:Uncharacterized protein n=1 Tax=Wohlfahrtiimonas larvae TaxID=1157986 RepID=A0ABP9MPR1_9GAMM|nr:hypothetical protein [Wohlfahrtiimonas larvae]